MHATFRDRRRPRQGRRISARSRNGRAARRGARAGDALGDPASRGPALRFIIGRDTRESGDWIERELGRGVHAEGAAITTAGVIPTPATAYITRAMGFDAGLVISASHNPFEDNGIKVFSGRGEKFTETLERHVESIIADTSWQVPAGGLPPVERTDVIDAYIAHTRLALPDPERLGPLQDRDRHGQRRDDDRGAAAVPRAGLRRHRHRRRSRTAATSTSIAARPIPSASSALVRDGGLPHGRGVRRRRRSRDLRRSRRARRRRRRRDADVRAAHEGAGAAERQRARRDRDEQHRPRDRAARVGHRAGALPGRRQVRDGGDDQARHLHRRRAVRATSSSRITCSPATASRPRSTCCG